MRRGLRMRLALEPDMAALGEAGDEVTAIELAALLQPDVVLVDDEVGGIDGIRTAAALRGLAPGTAVVILTLNEDAATRVRGLAAGAAAVVSKRRGPEELVDAIRKAAMGNGSLKNQ